MEHWIKLLFSTFHKKKKKKKEINNKVVNIWEQIHKLLISNQKAMKTVKSFMKHTKKNSSF